MLGKTHALAAAGAALLMLAGTAEAKTCRDAKGHFAACPTTAAKASAATGAAMNASARAPASATARTRCRDARGHFASCQAAAAPAPAPAARPSILSRITRAPTGTAANTAATAPAGPVATGAASARCRDGSLSYSKHRSGTCAGHGGVASWF